MSRRSLKTTRSFRLLSFLALAFSTAPLWGEGGVVQYDAEKEAEKARKNYIERFIKFTQDQNVSGKAKDPNGKVVQNNQKSRFNKDDGNSFESLLTYHDAAYSTADEEAKKQNPNDPKAQSRRLYAFISSHGGIAAGGGSSQLERTVYEKHTEYSKQDEDPEAQKKREKEKGIKYYSIFKEETRELEPNPKNPDQPESVSRVALRPEVKAVIEQVGAEAFQTVERSAKDPGAENDAKLMGNLTFYREAVARASKALWDSTLANLSQRRVFKEGEGSLSEGVASCESWAQNESAEIEKLKDADEKKDQQERLQKRVQQCKQMSQVSWRAVNPKFEDSNSGQGNGNNSGPQIKEKGPNYEDKYSRDLRNQMEVMDKVGVGPDGLQSNWKYDEEEFKNEVLSETDDEGNVSTVKMTNAEQLDAYNKALDESIESMKAVQKTLPDFQFDEKQIQAKKIQAGQKNILEINKVPDQMMEELGGQSNTPKAAENYSELLQEQSGDSAQ